MPTIQTVYDDEGFVNLFCDDAAAEGFVDGVNGFHVATVDAINACNPWETPKFYDSKTGKFSDATEQDIQDRTYEIAVYTAPSGYVHTFKTWTHDRNDHLIGTNVLRFASTPRADDRSYVRYNDVVGSLELATAEQIAAGLNEWRICELEKQSLDPVFVADRCNCAQTAIDYDPVWDGLLAFLIANVSDLSARTVEDMKLEIKGFVEALKP